MALQYVKLRIDTHGSDLVIQVCWNSIKLVTMSLVSRSGDSWCLGLRAELRPAVCPCKPLYAKVCIADTHAIVKMQSWSTAGKWHQAMALLEEAGCFRMRTAYCWT